MKYLLLLTSFITTAVSSQFNMKFYGQAGGNYTLIHITRTTGIEQANGGYGWQLGVGTEYKTSFGYFIYLGAGIRHETFEKDSTSAFFPDTVSQFKYAPLFISLPLGIGYPLSLNKNVMLKFYAGLNVQVGVAGKVTRHDLFYEQDSAGGAPILVRTKTNKHNLHYGRSNTKRYSYDLANSNWGIHIGAGIDLMQSLELNVFYHHGFTNFLPNKSAATEINKLSFFEVNARFYLPNSYLSEKKKKR